MNYSLNEENNILRVVFCGETVITPNTLFHQIDTTSKEIEKKYFQTSKPLLLDFSSLKQINSLIVNIIVRILRTIPYEHMAILAPHRSATRLLRQLGIHALVPIFSNEDEIADNFFKNSSNDK